MRFLLDVCAASRSMQTTLTALGHAVLSAAEHAPRATDEELLVLALSTGTDTQKRMRGGVLLMDP